MPRVTYDPNTAIRFARAYRGDFQEPPSARETALNRATINGALVLFSMLERNVDGRSVVRDFGKINKV